MTPARPTLAFQTIDPAVNPDPDACGAWATLRAERPVAWAEATDERRGFWVLTKYHDIVEAYRDPRLSSAQGNMLSTLTTTGDPAAGRMLVVTDPPRHTAIRRVLQSGFSRGMRGLEERLRDAADELVATAVERGTCEFAADVAAYIPVLAVCELLGVPQSDRRQMLDMTLAAMSEDANAAATEGAADARREILMYYAQLLPARRRAPGDDLVSLMLDARIDGRPLTDAEVVLNCYNILVGGDETARLSTVGGMLALIERPEQWATLKRHPEAIDRAIQEILRWTTPATHMCRVAAETVEIRGQRIASGDIVTLWNLSANRDEEVFEQPYAFDVRRTPNKHLTFGIGQHTCLGAALTRIELKVVFEALLEQASEAELAGPPRRLGSTFLAGVGELPVRLAAS